MAYRPRRRLRFPGFGDAAADSANYLAMAANVNPGSALYNAIMACAQNPTPTCATASASWFNAPYFNASQQAVLNQAVASGGTIPAMQANIGFPPGTYQPTPQVPPSAPPPPVTAPSTVVQSSSGGDVAEPIRSRLNPPGPTQTAAPVAAPQPAGIPYVPVSSPPLVAQGPSDLAHSLWQALNLVAPLGIPLWLWLAGGGLGLYAFTQGGGHGRY